MRLFIPHILCAIIVTIMSGLMAYAIYTQTSLDTYHVLRWVVGGVYILALSVIAWIAGVRAIEYRNLCEILALNLTTKIYQGSAVATINFMLKRELNALKFFGLEVQRAYGIEGRQRVLTAVIAKTMHKDWHDAQKILFANQVTRQFKTTWADYFTPGW